MYLKAGKCGNKITRRIEEEETRPPSAQSWIVKDSIVFNKKMFQAWQEQRSKWRTTVAQDNPRLERCLDQVLSQRNETKEGKGKQMRREKVQKAGKLTKSWRLMSKCK